MRSNRASLLRTCATTSAPSFATRRLYAAASKPRVLINKDTKVICQGFTGKQVHFLLPDVALYSSCNSHLARAANFAL
jgi:hypothetical protein